MAADVWDLIRLSRSEPFGRATKNKATADTYRAALQQFEELMVAARSTGPAGRPLPLFYALSQAGRAVAVARDGTGHANHGLTLGGPQADILATTVGPPKTVRDGQFQAVASCTSSEGLTRGVQIGALISSLPSLSRKVVPPRWPKPLEVGTLELPVALPPGAGWMSVTIKFDDDVHTLDDVTATLDTYPVRRKDYDVPQLVKALPSLPRRRWVDDQTSIDLLWSDSGGGLDAAFPPYLSRGSNWLRPALVHGHQPPSHLMTWWAVLFSLSMLARYHPVSWIHALDVDRSGDAVLLGRLMEIALEELPQLVLEALFDRPLLL